MHPKLAINSHVKGEWVMAGFWGERGGKLGIKRKGLAFCLKKRKVIRGNECCEIGRRV